MQLPEQKISSLDYIPARLTEGKKEWYVSFYAWHPVMERLWRKKVKLNRIQKISDRRDMARKLVVKINAQLAKGWNPFIEEEAPKLFHKLTEVIDTYMNIMNKDLEEPSLRSYRSFTAYLKKYVKDELKQPDISVFKFTDQEASDLMLFLSANPKISKRTYNNYLIFYRTLFNWMVVHKYKKTNPFKTIQKKKTPKGKNRIPIDIEIREKLKMYLVEHNFNYLTMMMIEYYCLLRPNEITYLKCSDIDLKKGFIRVNPLNAKNDNESFRTIPPILTPFLSKLNLINPNNYVFSDDENYKFVPGIKHMDSRKISKYWSRLRPIFGLGLEHKFYGFKDSGIIDLLEAGVSIEDVRDQADHSNISVTAIYARHAKPQGSHQIREKAREF